jgi:hypothetical protein
MDKVTKLATKDKYVKIEYKQDRVGWIDEEDMCKN